MTRRRRVLMLAVATLVSVGLLALPVSSRLIRLGQLSVLATALALALSFAARRVWLAGAGLGSLFLLGVLLAPARPVDAAALRSAYVSELGEMQGVRYVWGGEGGMGIDCSGLPRKALLDATFEQGVATFNPRLVRSAIGLWWNDLSARAIGARHRGTTVPVTGGASIRELDHGPLVPGDLAVTTDGKHLLVFVEGDEWIQADPAAGEVITVRATDDNQWLQMPVRVVRWRLLADA